MTGPEQNILEPALAINDLVNLFEKSDIPYFLVGSFASGIRGEFRATNDIDLVLQFSGKSIELFVKLANKEFIVDNEAVTKAINLEKTFNLIHEKTFTKIDIFTKLSELESNELSRATPVVIPQSTQSVLVATTEYNILAKLRWYLMSNKVLERQIKDIISMIEINKSQLDTDYLEYWAKKLNLLKELSELMNHHLTTD